jgi:predicted transcriptional regulator
MPVRRAIDDEIHGLTGRGEGEERVMRLAASVDDILLKALEDGGPATVNDILKRYERRVRMRLNKLRVRGVVVREGRGGGHREFTYRLVRPDVAAKALREKGGLARTAKVKISSPRCDRGCG